MLVLAFFISRSSPGTLNSQHLPSQKCFDASQLPRSPYTRRTLAASRSAEVSFPAVLGNLPYVESKTTGDRTVAWGFILTRGIPSPGHLAFSHPQTFAVFLCDLPLLALFPHAASSNLSALHKIPPGPSLHPPQGVKSDLRDPQSEVFQQDLPTLFLLKLKHHPGLDLPPSLSLSRSFSLTKHHRSSRGTLNQRHHLSQNFLDASQPLCSLSAHRTR